MSWLLLSSFHFQWPWALGLLLLIPLGWWLFLRKLRQRIQGLALGYSYGMVLEALQIQPAIWKRLLQPLAISLLAFWLILGLARPTVISQVPINSADMMLVLDISLSMMADDIQPDRLTAAKTAAIRFVRSLPPDARIGLEFFAGDSTVISPPILDHQRIIDYLNVLNQKDLKQRTEIGSALRTATQVLQGQSTPNEGKKKDSQGNLPDQVIILLSDGDSHEGYPWDLAAKEAKQQHITIHTIGVGSPNGGTIVFQGQPLAVNFSEETLRETAKLGGGSYFRVFKESDFQRVYEQIRQKTVHYQTMPVDLAFCCAGLGLLSLLALLVGSWLWL